MDNIGRLCREWRNASGKRKKERLRENILREIWAHYHGRLQIFLTSVPPAEREDRVSEILLKVFESLESYNPDYAFSTWLYRIARNSEIDRFRRKAPVLVKWEEEIHSPPDQTATPEAIVLRETDRERLSEAMAALKPTDREILYLACYEEMPYREISRIIGRPEGTVKYEMHRIRKELKIKLEEDVRYEAE